MNISWQHFRFPLDDERWQSKALIGGLLGLFGFIILPLLLPLWGYGVRLLRQTVKGEEPFLPEWDDWGQLFGDGLRMIVIGIVYTLPGLLLMCVAFGAWFISFVPAAAADQAGAEGLAIGAFVLTYALGYVLLGVAGLVTLPLAFLAVVGMTRMAAYDSLGSAFEFGEVWRLARAGLGNYLLAFAVWYGVIFLLSWIAAMFMYTLVLACLYPILIGAVGFYASVLLGALFGRAYFHTQSNLSAEEKALPA